MFNFELTRVEEEDLIAKITMVLERLPAEIFTGLDNFILPPRDVVYDGIGLGRFTKAEPVRFNPRIEHPEFKEIIGDNNFWETGDLFTNDIIIYPVTLSSKIKFLKSIFAHEIGHLLYLRIKGYKNYFGENEIWLAAKEADGKRGKISKYAETNIHEDFAEAVMVYIMTEGGRKNPRVMHSYANRFAIIDEIIEDILQERRRQYQQLLLPENTLTRP